NRTLTSQLLDVREPQEGINVELREVDSSLRLVIRFKGGLAVQVQRRGIQARRYVVYQRMVHGFRIQLQSPHRLSPKRQVPERCIPLQFRIFKSARPLYVERQL